MSARLAAATPHPAAPDLRSLRADLRSAHGDLGTAAAAVLTLVAGLIESGAMGEAERDAADDACLYLARARSYLVMADTALDSGGVP